MRAILSIIGLYNEDPELFSQMVLPESEHIDKTTLVNNILADFGELEIIYTNPAFFKYMLGEWSKSRLGVWEELCKTMDYEYNPIWNKDGTDHEYIRRDNNYLNTLNDAASSSSSGTTTNKGAAFNSGSLESREQDESSGSMSSSDHRTSSDTGYGTEERTLVMQGNIGVTSTQQLIQEQRELVKFNMYDIIKEEFKKRFCLLVY